MNQQPELSMNLPKGKTVKGWCKCGQECDCELKTFSNGKEHAWAVCPKCGSANYKQQRLTGDLETLKHKLMGIFSFIDAMPSGVNKDEAICMIERLAEDLWKKSE
jgi:hypothetical protein